VFDYHCSRYKYFSIHLHHSLFGVDLIMGKLIKYSKIWCNKTEVLPPNWLRAGQKGNQEIPLMDEGYEYRVPTMILLKKGWNTIVIKAPIGTTKSTSWHQPIKWMFTFIQVTND
jgi:hypothetical protein